MMRTKVGEKMKESIENRIEQLEYYQQLLIQMVDVQKYPFYKMVMREKLSKSEVNEVFALCEALSKKYEEQTKIGFVTFSSLLTHFVGMLNVKLNPEETIDVLYEQNLYTPLMKKLKELKDATD
jgi:hypothetical protein